uniref:Uncharacterized protein n=1 Tax=Eutreptiella gymnastica TaxID=73025 RepID=A0A7S4FSZ3_9EUGL
METPPTHNNLAPMSSVTFRFCTFWVVSTDDAFVFAWVSSTQQPGSRRLTKDLTAAISIHVDKPIANGVHLRRGIRFKEQWNDYCPAIFSPLISYLAHKGRLHMKANGVLLLAGKSMLMFMASLGQGLSSCSYAWGVCPLRRAGAQIAASKF